MICTACKKEKNSDGFKTCPSCRKKSVEYSQEYYKRNPGRHTKNAYENRMRRFKKDPWYKYWFWAYSRSKRLKRFEYDCYDGVQFDLSPPDVKLIWERDRAYELALPSIDRIDNEKGYVKSNIRFIEKSDNSRRRFRPDNECPSINRLQYVKEKGL